MKKQWAAAFTVVEIVIVVVVIGIIATVALVGYNGVQQRAAVRAAQSDLTRVAAEMERVYQKTKAYPTSLPADIKASNNRVTLTMKSSGVSDYYPNVTPVQNGVLVSKICTDLINEGYGRGIDNGGGTNNYISGCGQWNYNWMQIAGWENKRWDVAVSKQSFLDYANNFTTSTAFHKQGHESTVKRFYTELVTRFEAQGGSFPITTFWDFWASPASGGVAYQNLPPSQGKPYYCADTTVQNTTETWHVDQTAKLQPGLCS
jgi:Tfp pilus assembly protein PilE